MRMVIRGKSAEVGAYRADPWSAAGHRLEACEDTRLAACRSPRQSTPEPVASLLVKCSTRIAPPVGRPPERSTLDEPFALAGKFVALEIYTLQAIPLRRIEAIGDFTGECVRGIEVARSRPRPLRVHPTHAALLTG
jgi:hypothetical protein